MGAALMRRKRRIVPTARDLLQDEFSAVCGRREEAEGPGAEEQPPHGGRQLRQRSKAKTRTLCPGIQRVFFQEQGSIKCRGRRVNQIHTNPNVFEVYDFLTEGEMEHLDLVISSQQRKKGGFKASYTDTDTGDKVISEERTSTFFYVQKFGDSKVRAIEARAAEMIGLPAENVEPLQVVAYRDGQQFTEHHDAGTLCGDDGMEQVEEVSPFRLVTLFLYLNTLPPGQGETAFPRLNINVRPERNKAVVFCNCDENGRVDLRLTHAARPVDEGFEKYGMNIWITDSSLTHLIQSKCGVQPSKEIAAGGGQKRKRLILKGLQNSWEEGEDTPLPHATASAATSSGTSRKPKQAKRKKDTKDKSAAAS